MATEFKKKQYSRSRHATVANYAKGQWKGVVFWGVDPLRTAQFLAESCCSAVYR